MNKKHYKNKKAVPADNASLWVLTHKDDLIKDDSWEQWLIEQDAILNRILKRTNRKYPVPYNAVIKGKD